MFDFSPINILYVGATIFYLEKDIRWISQAINFVCTQDTKNTFVTFFFSWKNYHDLGENEISHLIYLRGDPKKEILYCYIELFSTLNFIIILNNEYTSSPFNNQYCYDILSKKILTKKIDLALFADPFSFLDFEQHFDETQEYIKSKLTRAYEILDRITPPKKHKLTAQIMIDLNAPIWTRVLQHFLNKNYIRNGLTIPFLIGATELIHPIHYIEPVDKFLFQLARSQNKVTLMTCPNIGQIVIGLMDSETIEFTNLNLYLNFGSIYIVDNSFENVSNFNDIAYECNARYSDLILKRQYSFIDGDWREFSATDTQRISEAFTST